MLPLLRGLALLIGLGVVGSAAMWVVTRERKWWDRAVLLLKVGVGAGLVFFGVLFVERLLDDGGPPAPGGRVERAVPPA